jgi:ABC-2 type transport system permease protein
MARLMVGLISLVITLVFGVIAFALPVSVSSIDWLLFITSTLLGIAALVAIGLLMGSLTMMAARHLWSLGDAITGALFLFSGAIFPLDVLPDVLRPIGLAFPVTYWLEVARRALLGENAPRFPTFASFSDSDLLLILLVLTVLLITASVFFYLWALHRAKETGLFDMETSY